MSPISTKGLASQSNCANRTSATKDRTVLIGTHWLILLVPIVRLKTPTHSNGLYSYQLDYPQSFAYQGEGHIFRSQWTDLFHLIPAVSNTFGQQLNYLKDGYASGKNWKKETNLGVV